VEKAKEKASNIKGLCAQRLKIEETFAQFGCSQKKCREWFNIILGFCIEFGRIFLQL